MIMGSINSPINQPKNSNSAARKASKNKNMAFRGRSSGVVAQNSGQMQTDLELQQMLAN